MARAVTASTAPATRRMTGRWLRSFCQPRGRPLGDDGEDEQGQRGPDGVEEGDEQGRGATRWLAAATEMAARTGPAHGTKTSPRLRPRTKPPPESA